LDSDVGAVLGSAPLGAFGAASYQAPDEQLRMALGGG